MERWRELGYVPDSQGEEEEDEDLAALLLASQDEKQTNKCDNGRTAGENEPESLPVSVLHEGEYEALGNKCTKPTTTQKSGRKRGIGKSESQSGEPEASGPTKRQRKQDDSSQRKEPERPAEQSKPFEPESSPDVLQMDDLVPRAALVRPSSRWKSALPHDEDDTSVLSTVSSSLSSVPQGLESPIPDAEESQQVLDGVVEQNDTSNSPDLDSDMLHISTKASLPDTDDVTIDAPLVHEEAAEIASTNPRNESPVAPQTDRKEPLRETPCNDVATSQSFEEREPQGDAPRTFTNTLNQSEDQSSGDRPVLEQPQEVPHSPPKYHGRALRPRTVLQEKPYQVELARYALFCKQQGIPFHMPKSREHLHEQQRQHGHRPGDADEINPNEEESQEYLDVVRDGGDDVSEDDDEQLASHERPLEERSVSRHFSRHSSLLRRPSRLPGTGPSMNDDADGSFDVLSKKRKTSHTYSRSHAPSMALSRYQQQLPTAEDSTERHQDVAKSITQGAGNDQSLIELLNIPEVPSSQAGSDQDTPRPQETSIIALLNELGQDDFGTIENNEFEFQEGSPSQEPRSKQRLHPNISQEVRELAAESDSESEAIGEPDANEIVTISDNDPIVDPTAGSDSDTPDAGIPSSSPNNDAPEPRDLQRLQKRIKGVLPASWVRLEMKLQQEKDKAMKDRERKRREATIAMRRARTDGKGVAQPITKGGRRNDAGKEATEQGQEPRRGFVSDFLGEDALEDSSDSEDNLAQPSAAAQSRQLADDPLRQLDLAGRPLDDGDIPEDNWIDYMLPPVHRGTRRLAPSDGERKRKKQARLGFESAQGMMTDISRPRQTSSRHPSLHKTNVPFSSVGGGRQSTWRADSSTAHPSWVKTIPGRGLPISTGGNLPTPSSSNKTTSSTSIRNQATKLRQSRIDDIARTTTGQRGVASSAPSPRQLQRSASERSAPPALTAVSDGPTHHGAHAKPVSAPRRQHLQKGRMNDYSTRKGYVLTSGRREALRPAGLENTALPIRLEKHALKKVASTNQSHIRGDTNVVQPILPGGANAPGNHGPSLVQANPQLQRYLYGDENDSPAWTADGHDTQTLTTEKDGEHIRHLPNHSKPREDGRTRDEDRVKTATYSNGPIIQKSCRLKGLNNLDTFITTSFGISHLPAGTYFHSSTIIGSGEIASALNVDSRPLDTDCGYTIINHDSMSYRWGAWAEPVASDLANVFQEIRTVLSELCHTTNTVFDKPRVDRTVDLYRSAITYVSDKLFFIDSIDRKNFVGRCALFLHGNLQTRTSPPVHSSEKQGYEVLLRTLDMVFAAQIYKIAMIEPPLPEMESDVQVLMKRAADLVIMLTYSEPGQKDLDDVLKDTGVTVLRESGIRNDHPYAGALVTLLVLGRNFKWLTAAVQHMMLSRFLPSTADRFEVLNLERGWRLLLSTLPFTSFDEKGTMEPDYDCKEILGQWPIVIELLAPVFSAYEDEVFVRALDGYCRVLFCRCFHIITYWKWQSWQDILQYLFKFFSTRKLRNLPSEGLCGSPAFLTQLEKTPTLQVEVRDSTFHVFLKIIGVSWHHMAKVYDQQKLQNFARRLIPLHERQFPKDESLNQQDLDELRNHHDLLSTLYWAIPEKFRFRVATIRWLVQPLNSHTEASLININSWLRLTRFKLSTDEDISGLTPFTDWHSAFTKDMLKLHALARTEIEAQAVGNNRFSRELLDSVIEENQKQIETLLGTTLINMALALRAAPSIDHARAILQGFPLVELLDRFHAINWRSSTVVCQVLDIILAFTATETCQTTSQRQAPIVIDKNDESQEEYGDWSAFAELSNEDLVTPGPGIHFLNDTVRPVVLRLASRYFGDDRSSVEPVLYRIIDCWVAVALLLVRYGLRGWSTQLNQYNPESWTSLPWTDRTRKLTPYVLARLIEADHSVYTQCKQEILKHWISCIVERGSVLIHQHSLTSALLNVDRRSPLLTNLPFSRVGTESYAIALDEFSQRRLSLISSVLSNMREHVTSLYQNKSPDYQTVNESYRELVETLMRVMKSNYQELGQGNQYVQGQYVGFVHSVIGFLQQHVQQICPLDNFFTDPKAFPLPADDPSYIAAKLLSYEVRLTDEKIGMQLVTFIQSVSERAAVDGQQTHFVDQLYTAVSRSLERTRTGKPTMLDIIVTCVLPGYMEASLKNPVAWLLARPFLQSLTRTFNDMLLHVNVYDQDDVSSTIWTLSFFFSELDQSLRLLVDHPGLLDEPRILVTMVSYLETIMASVPAIDYIARSTSDAQVLVSYVQVFNQMALFAYSCLSDPATAWAPDLLDLDGGRSNATPAILLMLREFATNELDSWLKSTWSHRGGRYYVRQGPRWEEVVVNPDCLSLDVVRPAFVQTVKTFCSIISLYETFNTHLKTDRP